MKSNIIKSKEFKIFLTIWLISIFFISGYGGGYIQESALHLSMAIVDNQNFIVTPYMKEGCKLTGCDYSLYKENYYSGFAPGASFLAVPVYFIFKPILVYSPRINTILLNILATIFISSLLSALVAVLIYKLSGEFTKNEKYRLITTFLFSFSTIYFYYSTWYSPKLISGFFAFLSFYLLFQFRKSQNNGLLFLSGFSAAYSAITDYPSVIILALISLYALISVKNKRIFIYALGALIPIIVLLSYHYVIFDNPLSTTYSHRAYLPDFDVPGGKVGPSFDFNRLFEYSFSPKFGVFFFMPVLFLSLIGIFIALKTKKSIRKEILFSLLIPISSLLYYTLFFNGSSYCTFGPRYLLPMIPFLYWPIIFAFRKINKLLMGIVAAISVFINLLPVLYWGHFCYTGNNIILEHYIPLLKTGLTNYTLNLISNFIFPISLLYINIIMIIGLLILALIIYLIWRKNT